MPNLIKMFLSTGPSACHIIASACLLLLLLFSACGSQTSIKSPNRASATQSDANNLFIVDCLLPGQVRKLGQSLTYLSARRAIKATASECEIRGGEYVSYDRANFATALKIWLPEAKKNKPEAQTYVGEIYEKGLGVTSDYVLAASWYQKAAEQGYSRAQINLGYLYEKGLGVEKDAVTALNWYRKASGLADDKLAYASTISVGTGSEYLEEIKLLKNELEVSKKDIESLRGEVLKSKQQVSKAKEQFNRVQQELDKTRNELNNLKSSPLPDGQSNLEIQKLEQLELKEAEAAKQLEELRRMENLLDQKNQSLTEQLKFAEQRVNWVNQELAKSNRKSKALEDQLSKTENQLTDSQTLLKQLKDAYEFETDKINLQKQKLQKQKSAALAENEAQLKELQFQVAQRENKQNELLERIAQLETQERNYQNEIKNLQSSKSETVTYAAPSIEIIDPPFTVTRGKLSVVLRSPMQSREVIGKITAPAGLLSFNINGKKEPVSAAGLFKSMIELQPSETEVKTVAIDNVGKKSELAFTLFSYLGRQSSNANLDALNEKSQAKKIPDIDFGQYHALIIGNNLYTHLPSLDTPINDALTVDKILSNKYGFKTILLSNADRYTILSALNKLRETLTKNDNLLIYYAGHGELDRANLRGHWLPVDAEPTSSANWISTVAITDVLNSMSARHILVIADSCYSGAMTRASLARLEPGLSDDLKTKWLKRMAKSRSRTVLTSGALKPVLDGGGGGHSVFAKAFIDAISNNNKLLEGQTLYRQVSKNVKLASSKLGFEQSPQYAPVRHCGHEAGDFFFVPTS